MNPILLPLNELKPALAGLGKVINRHTTQPILGGIRVERTADGWVCLTATDLDRFVTVRLEQPDQGGASAMVVSSEDLQRFSKSCGKGETLQLEHVSDDTALLKFPLAGQTGEARLRAFPHTEFPEVPKLKGEPIPLAESLRQSLLEALECSSANPGRPILQGVCLDVSKAGAHYVVGTDGRHLYSSNSFTLPLTQSVLLPRHKFLVWRDFVLDGNWRLKVEAPSSTESDVPAWVQLSSRRWRFISRQMPGNYPQWQTVVPDMSAVRTTLTLDMAAVEQVQQAITRLPCHEPQHQTLGLAWEHGEAALLAKAPEDQDWTRVSLPHVQGKGPDQRVFVDRRFVSRALEFGLCTLSIIDELSPVRFSEGGRQMIIMTLRPSAPEEPPASGSPTQNEAPPPAPSTATEPSTLLPQPENHPATANAVASATQRSRNPVEQAIEVVDELRAHHSQSQEKLRDLGTRLRLALREQKSTAKELHTFRQRLRTLQAVQL